ncbi:MAG: L-2-hydroxyglutarate oxidase [Actinomycetota bacterium]|nr:L-2-hydroxyglutarate oxidase [Actinomycetota bacterium]
MTARGHVRFVIVGGGILGLASAERLIRAVPGAEVTVLEKEHAVGLHQSSHNSGVVHAGLYYAPGSLKARLCRRGSSVLRAYCETRGIAWEACGKVVVATRPDELGPLERLAERASANGVPGLRWLDRAQLTEVEHNVTGLAGLHSPETAIVDFGAVTAALAADVRADGGEVRTSAVVRRVLQSGRHPAVELSGGELVRGDRVIVCAGLQSDRLATSSGEPASPRIVPFRGEYWELRPERAHLVRGLIYPVPDAALPFLGVHLTRRPGGGVWLGPNAVLSLAREGYGRLSFGAHDTFQTLTWVGTWRMMRRYWRTGAGELYRSLSRHAFISEIQRYVPAITPDDVVRAPAGIRAQAVDRDGTLVDDFRLSVRNGVVWVRNAPSPGATSALAIAEELVELALR